MDQTERLKAGQYDLVLCSYQPVEYSLQFTPVVELPFVVAMRRDDPLVGCRELTPEQLAGRSAVP